ncbi:MAG: hypothetical protein ACI920_003850, partial [Saprospiraceae bacterium]
MSVRLSGKDCKRSHSIGVGILTAKERSPYQPSFCTTMKFTGRMAP